jgi:beta-galactosidase
MQPADVTRRTLLKGATVGTGVAAFSTMTGGPAAADARGAHTSAAAGSPRQVYSLNVDWRFAGNDVAGAQAPGYNDSAWQLVSVPHTFNDTDSFDQWITSSGQAGVARKIVWYRKHFTLPAAAAGSRVVVEIEGVRQAATVFVNGTQVGLYEYGVMPFGFDVTSAVKFGADNVIAIKADNSDPYKEAATGTTFEWDARDFNPVYGGLTRDVRLHVLPATHFTFPLYASLGTTGTYVYATNFNIPGRSATITAEAQVRNEGTASRTVSVSANLIDASGTVVHTFPAATATLAAGATQVLAISDQVSGLTWWNPGAPYLYTVQMLLSSGGTVVDIYPVTTGFRQAEFKGGGATGGVYINGNQVFLSGYAQRATNEWALLGGAVPEWLRDVDGQLITASNANLIRWMHISSEPANIRMTDRHGIVSIQPAGDKESDATGRQWDQRAEVMRDSMIYFRNSPSILFWEAGNNVITAAHMTQMHQLRQTWDPHGGRAVGCRSISDNSAYGGTGAVDQAEYVGTMLDRHYSDYARDRVPIIECEYTRDEAPRRVWDNASPPDFGYKTASDATYHWTSEDFAGTVAASTRYEFWSQRIQGPGNQRYSGAAALTWSDSNQHGRQYHTETCRESGRVDALRLPKESFYTYRVMQSPTPDIHLIGHWTYPAGTTKTMYVMASHVASVALLINGKQVATSKAPTYDYLYTFPGIKFTPGTIEAVGYDAGGHVVVRHDVRTAGAPVALRVTVFTASGGLRADGADVFYADVEVIDAQGRRCPTDQARVDFALSGPATLLGSYNAGVQFSVFKPYANTECGINRVFARATRTPGTIMLTATRQGLATGSATVTSVPVTPTGGLLQPGGRR